MSNREWIGVDLDGTLAHYDGWMGADPIGDPIPKMVHRVRQALSQGKRIKIFTARVGIGAGFSDVSQAADTIEFADHQREIIQNWTEKYFGVRLEVTAQKDFLMIELWDDRARQVVPNTGEFVEDLWRGLFAYIYEKMGGVFAREEV